MKRFLLASALLSGGLLALSGSSYAHGGTYRGPGDTVPPAGGGGGSPNPGVPGPGGSDGPHSGPGRGGPGGRGAPGDPSRPTTPDPGPGASDLTTWQFWWEFNKHSYMNLKSTVRSGSVNTGSSEHFLGRGHDVSAGTLAPTQRQIQQVIVPELLEALRTESNNDIITGALIALAKIGDVNAENGKSEFEQVLASFLSDVNAEISETAAVSLGIMASPSSISLLEELLMDSSRARKELVKRTEVPYRTRAFAAYGLGLIGARSTDDDDRRRIVDILVRAIDKDDTRSRDLKVACIISLGLAPISEVDSDVGEGEERLASSCRDSQIQYLFDYLNDKENEYLVRAHCPTALARLVPNSSKNETLQGWREKLAADFQARCSKSAKEHNEVVQSAVIGLGLLGDNGSQGIGPKIRATIQEIPQITKDQQARNFSMIAAAKAGGTHGAGKTGAGITEIGEFLSQSLVRGKSAVRPWAGLAIGVLAQKLESQGEGQIEIAAASKVLRKELQREKNPERIGAYAIAAGLMHDEDSKPVLLEHLAKLRQSETRGYVCVSLALMGATEARDPLRAIVSESIYKPQLLKQAATALGLLGDKDLVPLLTEMLSETTGRYSQAALASALGTIGDKRSVDPLVQMLRDKQLNPITRGFAAVALGIVADKELLPWNAKIAEDLNYRAATSSLVDNASGTGILDIL